MKTEIILRKLFSNIKKTNNPKLMRAYNQLVTEISNKDFRK